MTTYLFIDEGNIINVVIEYVRSVNIFVKGSIVSEKERRDELMRHFDVKSNYIFFGIRYTNFPKINRSNVYFVNIEPLTCDGRHSNFNFLKEVIDFNKQYTNINLLDYSRGNINILDKYNIKSKYLPYYINNEEIKNFDKEYDLCTCCSWNERIAKIYTPLSHVYKGFSIGNPTKWGEERDDILFRSKVLINLHHREKDYNILQELRITRCILNRIIVISEHALDDNLYPLNDLIIFCDYDKIVDKAIDVLNNYNKYYDKIYKNMDYEEIRKTYEQHLVRF